jgi:pyruvate carboxylase
MFEKSLVANRGEIAARAFRASNELGVRCVAVYAPEDRDPVHRLKPDESYEIGASGRPVRPISMRSWSSMSRYG